MTAGKVLSSRDMPNAKSPRDTQAILSSEIDWDAAELQGLSTSARDFLERLLQVGCRWDVCRACAMEGRWLAWPQKQVTSCIAQSSGAWLVQQRASTRTLPGARCVGSCRLASTTFSLN
jgi:hypothetical protein